MKKMICLLLSLLLLAVPLTVSAAADPVVDMAGLLSEEQEVELTELLLQQGIGTLCVVTLESLNGAFIEDYAEDYAERNGIGVLFLISMEERKWCITASGEYEDVIDGYAIDQISAACLPDLQSGDYYGAFAAFAYRCAGCLEEDIPGKTQTQRDVLGRFLVCLLIGLAAGGITAGVMAGKNRSVRPKNNAADYVRRGSMNVTVSRDIYLYHHVTRTPRPQSNSSGGGGGSRSTRSGGF